MLFILDDTRDPIRDLHIDEPFVLARTVKEAKEIILGCPKFDRWSLDYDLGHVEPTGLYFLEWAAENCKDKLPSARRGIYVHSQHPAGKRDMKLFLQALMAAES